MSRAKYVRVEIFRSAVVPVPEQPWFWRIRWSNGRIAAVSEGYAHHGTAMLMARKMAHYLGVFVQER